ncbi:MAG TPA: MauE/DoxX family redox-associated membrane protein [Capillimicrobium sp.]|nr:MauE/DoxX family redox-associated membrane protein [Capillimicrobium sp.]
MTTLLLVARLALAAVFAAAAAGKLTDRHGARQAARELGVPSALAGTVALALPAVELGVAAALLSGRAAAAAAAVAALLLLAFTAALAVALARGRRVACHCFGELSSRAPAGPRTLARNAALLAAALAVAIAGRDDGGPSAIAWIGELDAATGAALAVAVVAVLAAACCATLAHRLLRSHGIALARLDAMEAAMRGAGLDGLLDEALAATLPAIGPRVGEPAPAFALEPAGGGAPVSLERLLARERPVLAVFADAECAPCRALVPRLAAWQREHADRLSIALIGGGDPERMLALAAEHGLDDALLDPRSETYAAYAMAGTPSAVLIAADGTVAAPGAAGAAEVEALVRRATGGALPLERWSPERPPEGLPVGAAVPDVTVEAGDGERVGLREALGATPAVVLFWNPGCGFCDRMRDDVAAWPAGAPKLVVVSREPDPDVGARLLVDRDGAAAAAFDAGGTPMAVLVDGDGRVATPLAAGRDEVLALAGAGAVAA